MKLLTSASSYHRSVVILQIFGIRPHYRRRHRHHQIAKLELHAIEVTTVIQESNLVYNGRTNQHDETGESLLRHLLQPRPYNLV